MRRRDLLGGLSLVPLAAPAVAQCVVATFPRINLPGRCEGSGDMPSLDLTFMVPGSLDPRVTFVRASVGTYFDAAGVMQTATTNTPRWDYAAGVLQGMLIEEARTNLLLNSATLSTQSVTVTAVAHTLSFYGTGTITKSGTATGALVGTGVGQRVSQTFTPTAGSLTCTVTGTVNNAQLEAGAFVTSYIPSTGAAATRSVEQCSVASIGAAPWFNAASGSMALDYAAPRSASVGGISDGTTANRVIFDQIGTVRVVVASVTKTLTPAPVLTYPAVNKTIMSYQPNRAAACLNGGTVVFDATIPAGPFLWTTRLSIGSSPHALDSQINGYVQRVRFWNRALSDAELQSATA